MIDAFEEKCTRGEVGVGGWTAGALLVVDILSRVRMGRGWLTTATVDGVSLVIAMFAVGVWLKKVDDNVCWDSVVLCCVECRMFASSDRREKRQMKEGRSN